VKINTVREIVINDAIVEDKYNVIIPSNKGKIDLNNTI